MVSSVDGTLHHLGKPGGYHLLVVILLCLNYFPIAFHSVTNVFYSVDIPHNCRLPEGWPWHKKFSIPLISTVGGQAKYDECQMFIDPNSAKLGTKACVYGWEFFPRGREWTINAEWGLVCEREYLVTLVTTLYYGGAMFGGLVFGTLADKFGRRPLLLFALYAQTAVSVGVYVVRSFILYAMLRFVHALLLQGLQATTLCLLVELPLFRPASPTKSPSSISRRRAMAVVSCSLASAVASICLALVTMGVQHWRYIQLAISLPCIATFVYIWLIPESVRWLVTVAKTESALSAAHKYAAFNRRPLDDKSFVKDSEAAVKQISASSQTSTSSSVSDVDSYGLRELLFSGPVLRMCTLVLCCGWFSASALHKALTQSLLELTADSRLSIVVVGFVDIVSFVFMYFLLTRFGRKKPLCALLVLSGAICISTVMAQNLERNAGSLLEVRVVTTILTLVERSCMAACLTGLTVCAAELFPTVVRTFGIGVCLFCGQAGWLAAPYILRLSVITVKAIPWVIIGSLVLVSGVLIQLLPEMSLKHLPDTLEDVEMLEGRKKQLTKEFSGMKVSPSPTVTSGDGQASSLSPKTPAQDYRDHITSIVEGQDVKSGMERRWYQKNYSRRSAKVVRFYGVDGGGLHVDDPCQQIRNGKKEGIRMVHFSFENEEFRMDPRSPMKVRRFSVITEEPELEVVDDEEVCGKPDDSPKQMNFCVEESLASNAEDNRTTRFIVRRVDDDVSAQNGIAPSVQKQSRFVVQRVEDSVAKDGHIVDVDNNLTDQVQQEKISRFLVQRVMESCVPSSVDTLSTKTSRFLVQRVPDESAVNNNNNNEKASNNNYKNGDCTTNINLCQQPGC